jgi:hypothetical protein
MPGVFSRQFLGAAVLPDGLVETIHSRDKANKMKNLLKLLWQEQKGQDLTEYALLLALLALGATRVLELFRR